MKDAAPVSRISFEPWSKGPTRWNYSHTREAPVFSIGRVTTETYAWDHRADGNSPLEVTVNSLRTTSAVL